MKKILLLSAGDVAFQASGISRWTLTILESYSKYKSGDFELEHYCRKDEVNTFASDNIIKRLRNAIHNYCPLIRDVYKKLKSENYDLVHLCTSGSLGFIKDLLLLYLCRRRVVKTITHFHFGRIQEVMEKGSWEKILMKKVLEKSTYTIVIDKKSYDTLLSYGYTNVLLLANPLSEEIISFVEKNRAERVPGTFLFAGHVVKTKGVFELIDACKSIGGIQLKIIGNCDPIIREQLIIRAGADYNRWLNIVGHISYMESIREMLSCELFILPTYTEGFPNVILESMACGCPIITTDVGAIPEMLDIENMEPCGICVKPRDSNSLHEAILHLHYNPDLSRQYGMRAKKRANEMYSGKIVYQKLEEIWNSIINE